MDIEQIRSKIKDTYKSFSSYQDSGEIISYNFDQGLGWFTTCFLRPNQLIFEFSFQERKDEKHTLIVKGDRFQLIDSGKFAEQARKMHRDFAKTEVVMRNNWPMSGLGGVSFGMSDTILPMLIPNSGRPCFIHNKLALLKDEIVDGEPCYHLREIFNAHHIWVSKNDFTIRRSETYGCPMMNNVMIKYASVFTNLTELFSRQKLPAEINKMLESSTASDWRFKTIQYNHLDADTFPKFEFREAKAVTT